jgi:hypothetical protein
VNPQWRAQTLNLRSYFLNPTLHASLTISPLDDFLHISPFFGVQRGVRNEGFNPDPDNPDFDGLSGYSFYTGGIGVEVRYEFLSVGAAVMFPFGGAPGVGFGPSITMTGGVVFQ